MTFSRLFISRRGGSSFALAAALATGTVLTAVAIETPADAQRARGDRSKQSSQDRQDESARSQESRSTGNYSKGFVAAYTPVKELQDAPTADTAALVAAVPTLVAAIENEDDRFVAGNTIYSIGRTAEDAALQYRGVTMMLQSGKVPAENVAQYNFLAGQLAYNAENYGEARQYLQAAYDAGHVDPDPRMLVAESYFQDDQYAQGFNYLDAAIQTQRDAGVAVDQAWLRRALAVAYQNELVEPAMRYASLYAQAYPSQEAWTDVVAVALNLGNYQAQEALDLLRLARRLDAMQHSQMYLEYIEAADSRRLPGEVVAVIDQGWDSGVLDRDNSFAVASRAEADSRLAADRADLPQVAKEARATGAPLNAVVAAGDAHLSFERYAEAEEFYAKALGMSGVNTPAILTRLGIAQLDQGKYDEAQATFAKVDGQRKSIAQLWSIYAAQQAG